MVNPWWIIIARTGQPQELLNKRDRRNNRARHLASRSQLSWPVVLLNNLKSISPSALRISRCSVTESTESRMQSCPAKTKREVVDIECRHDFTIPYLSLDFNRCVSPYRVVKVELFHVIYYNRCLEFLCLRICSAGTFTLFKGIYFLSRFLILNVGIVFYFCFSKGGRQSNHIFMAISRQLKKITNLVLGK